MELSLRWAERCKRAFESGRARAMLCSASCKAATILRCARESARALVAMDFQGYAIGGLAVGEPQEAMLKVVEETAPALPAERPRYLMGVGTPHDLLEAVARGIDMFDCVLPTRNGRHGMAFTRCGAINLGNARHADDARPLDDESAHPAARTYSRAYLHHLTKANEMLGAVLLSTVNLAYYQELMAGMRAAIAAGRFEAFRAATIAQWEQGDLPPPSLGETGMSVARMIALLTGFAVLYVLQFVVLWPWYYAIPAAIVCYTAVRFAGEAMIARRGPPA